MGRLWSKATDCNYKEYVRLLTDQFIHGLDNEVMISEILRKVSPLEDIDDIMSKRELLWTWRGEVQRAQKEALNNMKGAKEFDSVRHGAQTRDDEAHKKQKRVENCKYCGIGHLLRQCTVYSKR